jgi:glucose/arabinose dehydrogenase
MLPTPTMRTMSLTFVATVMFLSALGAQAPRPPQNVADPDGRTVASEKQTFKMEVVARDIETPWALAFLPDGRLLITERPGHLRIVQNGKLLPEAVKGTPKVWEKQDGGLLDVEVHPQYARNGWIYLAYSETLAGSVATPPADPPSMTVIVRGKINKNNEWVEEQVLFRAPPAIYNSSNAHYGSRFIFDRNNHLFFSLGEKQQVMDAQDLSKPTGKIHRVNDDGTVPKDNPFVNRAGALPTIWSYGHRNPQGLAWDPVTGKLWESEHGPNGGDEINIIEPGRNYGWGVITMGTQAGMTKREEPGMEQPVVFYTPTLAPAGMTFYSGDKYPGWKNHLFVGGLAGQQLRRLETSGDTVTHQEAVFKEFGRVRDVVIGPDGYLYVLLQRPGDVFSQSTAGMVARLVPVKQADR